MVGTVWPGLISIDNNPSYKTSTVIFDGMQINTTAMPTGFKGTIEAFTKPTLTSTRQLIPGLQVEYQRPKFNCLSWRRSVHNVATGAVGYKLYLLQNIILTPQQQQHDTEDDRTPNTRYKWDFTAQPEVVGSSISPSPLMTVDSTVVSASFLTALENRLYGNTAAGFPTPLFPTFTEIYTLALGTPP